MKKYAFLFLLLLTAACKKDGNCFRKGGNYSTQLRDTSSFFQAIRIFDIADLEFETGQANRIECTAPDALQDMLSTTVDTSTLTIRNQNKCRWLGKYDERFTIRSTMPNIYNLEIMGNNHIKNTDTIRSGYFRVYLETASGSLNLKVQNEEMIFSEYSGICDSRLYGSSQRFEVACAGNAAKHFEHFSARKAQVINAGAGDIYLGPCDTLEAELRFSGNIYYSGDPVISKYIRLAGGKLIKH